MQIANSQIDRIRSIYHVGETLATCIFEDHDDTIIVGGQNILNQMIPEDRYSQYSHDLNIFDACGINGAAVACGSRRSKSRSKIIGGRIDDVNDWDI